MNESFKEVKFTFTADLAVEQNTEIPTEFLLDELANKIRMSCNSLVGNQRILIEYKEAA